MLVRALAGVAAVFGSAEVNSGGPAQVAQAKPFVTALYQRYQKGSIVIENPTMIYSPALLREMYHARSGLAFGGTANRYLRDPLCNCTRYDVTSVKINITPLPDGRADAAVTFRNFGKPERVALTLVDVNGEWRVDDIRGTHHARNAATELASLRR